MPIHRIVSALFMAGLTILVVACADHTVNQSPAVRPTNTGQTREPFVAGAARSVPTPTTPTHPATPITTATSTPAVSLTLLRSLMTLNDATQRVSDQAPMLDLSNASGRTRFRATLIQARDAAHAVQSETLPACIQANGTATLINDAVSTWEGGISALIANIDQVESGQAQRAINSMNEVGALVAQGHAAFAQSVLVVATARC